MPGNLEDPENHAGIRGARITSEPDRIERLERFLEHDPENPALLRDLARAYHQSGEQDKALDLCARLTKIEGESASMLNLAASVHLARCGHVREWAFRSASSCSRC